MALQHRDFAGNDGTRATGALLLGPGCGPGRPMELGGEEVVGALVALAPYPGRGRDHARELAERGAGRAGSPPGWASSPRWRRGGGSTGRLAGTPSSCPAVGPATAGQLEARPLRGTSRFGKAALRLGRSWRIGGAGR